MSERSERIIRTVHLFAAQRRRSLVLLGQRTVTVQENRIEHQ